jgi:hypothetical protein
MPTLIESHDGQLDRLGVAASHIESAIAHINNVIQTYALTPACDQRIEELRLMVIALADIRNQIKAQTDSR